MTMTAQYRPYRDEDGCDGLDNDQLAWSDHEPGTIQIYEKTTEDLPFTSNRRFLFGTIAMSLLMCFVGFLIGYFAHSHHSECVPNLAVALHSVRDENPLIREKILKNIDSNSIKSVVKEFSKSPRIAGSQNDLRLALQVKDFFGAHSFDRVDMKNYTVLLSMADKDRPNYIELIDESRVIFSSLSVEKSQISHAYCAYSPPADLTRDVIFVNYGSESDYRVLYAAYNITRESLIGKIFIAKQYHLTAEEQLKYAQNMGAAALLLYPDPEHYNPNSSLFPDAISMPADAVRRDSLLWNGMGDPLTPGYPATPYAYRLPLSSINGSMPSIPVQPLSYSSAYEIMKRLGGYAAPKGWGGGFNFTYRLGPGFQNTTNLKLHLKINNKLVNKTIYNIIGYIKGRVEPDRYVIIGNHRDAWVNGAVDAAGGTGALLELSRVFGDLVSEGWRPRRTIVFCSWGAEEFNLIGSTEWIEEYAKILHERAVAYVNSDIIVVGNGSISVAASPLLYHLVFNATKEVPNPNTEDEEKTVYDKWVFSFPNVRNASDMSIHAGRTRSFEDDDSYHYDGDSYNSILNSKHEHLKSDEPNEPGALLKSYMASALQEVRPRVRPLDMRSVCTPFFSIAGIPVVEAVYINSKNHNDGAPVLTYPLLHTQYDTMNLIEDLIDPDFRYHKAITQILGEIVRDLADSLFLPFNLLDYAQVIKDFHVNLKIHPESAFFSHGIDLSLLDSAIKNFTKAAVKFHDNQDKLDFTDPMAIRRVNDQLLLLERAFLDYNGLPRNVMKRHIVLSPSETNPPFSEMFPGLMDEIFMLLQSSDISKASYSWDVIKAHFSILVFTIQSAAETISDVV